MSSKFFADMFSAVHHLEETAGRPAATCFLCQKKRKIVLPPWLYLPDTVVLDGTHIGGTHTHTMYENGKEMLFA